MSTLSDILDRLLRKEKTYLRHTWPNGFEYLQYASGDDIATEYHFVRTIVLEGKKWIQFTEEPDLNFLLVPWTAELEELFHPTLEVSSTN